MLSHKKCVVLLFYFCLCVFTFEFIHIFCYDEVISMKEERLWENFSQKNARSKLLNISTVQEALKSATWQINLK